MGTFTSSNLPGATIAAMLAAGGTTVWSTGGFVANTVNVALYGTTPDTTVLARDDTAAHNVYLAVGGQWVTGNESTGTGYTAGGNTIGATKSIAEAAGVVLAKTTASPGVPVWTITGTLTATFGCLVYDNTASPKIAYCWNYFGGSQTVTAGTFTVNWSSSPSAGSIYTVTIT